MNRKHIFSENENYHLYNRGVDKRIIFQNPSDYHRFILLLYLCNSKKPVDLEKIFREGPTFPDMFRLDRNQPLVAIGAWCLMPNHFHILIREICPKGITEFMRKLTTGYSMYFNKKYQRSGSLFQGKFKSEHITNANYFKYIFSYIHMNPISLIKGEFEWKDLGIKDIKNVEKFLQNYEYSSWSAYSEHNKIYKNILTKELALSYFPNAKEQIEDVRDWLSNPGKVGPSQK